MIKTRHKILKDRKSLRIELIDNDKVIYDCFIDTKVEIGNQ